MLKAKDIMTVDVYSVHEDTELKAFAALLEKTGVSTMPVVDEANALVGVVSATDLIDRDKPLHIPTVVSLFDWVIYWKVKKISKNRFSGSVPRPSVKSAPNRRSHVHRKRP